MLEVKNIHAAYGKVNVLRGIDLHLEEGEIVAVLGSNGAGKTTLNHNLCGLYCPVGFCEIFGHGHHRLAS